MNATPDPARPSLEHLAVLEPPDDGRPPAGTSDRLVAAERPQSPKGLRSDPVWLAAPQLPPWPVVWFALADGPAGEREDQRIRVWGLAVDDGRGEPRPEAITAGPDDPDGRHAWEGFVARAEEIIERHPEARWVHYSARERDRVLHGAACYGAPPGFLARLEEALFELLARGVRRTVGLPPAADSIRQVAELAGFRWRRPRPGPDRTDHHPPPPPGADPVGHARILRGLADSSAENLLAMRAVWRWMLEQGPRAHCG